MAITSLKKLKTIKIGAHTFDIVHEDFEEEKLFGKANLSKQKIFISPTMSKSMTSETILHECIHMISELNGLELGERTTQSLAHAIYLLIKENKLW